MSGSSHSPLTVGAGRYELIRRLGAGQFGTVHLARDLDEGDEVAVKLFNAGVPLDAALMEGRLQRRLSRSDRIVSLRNIDARTSAGPIVVSDYWPGGSVEDRLRRGQAGLVESARWVRDALDALVHAHGQNVFHRDAKPSNLLLDAGDHAALTDFGVSDDAIRGVDRTDTYPALLAPEFVRTGTTTVATEIWMVGVLAYRLVCGVYPYPMGAPAAAGRPPAPPQSLDPQIPAALQSVILTALSPDPAQRYGTMELMRRAVLRAPVVTSFTEVTPPAGVIAQWEARVPRGTAVVDVVPASRGRFQARLRLDLGSGPRTVEAAQPRSTEPQARRDSRTLLHAVVEGRKLNR